MNSVKTSKYDAIIVGSGPNGLAAGIRLAMEGLHVKIFEAKESAGGGMRTQELLQPNYYHDICSAIHPMAISSPFFKQLPLEEFGLTWIQPKLPVAHPLDNKPAAIVHSDFETMATSLDDDESIYRSIMEPIVEHWETLTEDFLGPLRFPSHPFQLAKFGMKALQPASFFQRKFNTEQLKALFAGMCAHSMLPLSSLATTAMGLVFFGTAHTGGWPMPKGGSQKIADAMLAYFKSIGGEIEMNSEVTDFRQLPNSQTVLFDLTPRQVSKIMGNSFPERYHKKLSRYQYGPGAFKVDYILKEPVPWSDPSCNKAGTVHLGGTFNEIAKSEQQVNNRIHSKTPFVLAAQQSLFDNTRTPDNKQTLWAYCHVPNGSTKDMTSAIENQIERFAPGFKDIIEDKVSMNTYDYHQYNANYIGGDINGGRQDITQLFRRPTSIINPYSTPAKGVYFCSSSTPPGGGVHGMCGYHAANRALKNEFGINQ